MKLDKRHMGVSVALLIGSIIYNVWIFTGSGKAKAIAPPSASIQTPPSGQPITTSGGPIDPGQVKALPDVALDRVPEWSRNPFQNVRQPEDVVAVTGDATPAPVPEADPVVGTILYSSDRRAAVVDGHIVRIGDMIGTSKVVDILPKAVIIDSPDRGRRTLEMRPGSGTGSVPARGTGAATGPQKAAPPVPPVPPGGRK